ncbi:unnamed protein product [Symbiodinium sp. CCMP2592]|nr:unnamed protein product [Symbiodinium sp. CCMP2592]
MVCAPRLQTWIASCSSETRPSTICKELCVRHKTLCKRRCFRHRRAACGRTDTTRHRSRTRLEGERSKSLA